jgi:F-type H+-transporting ATPase subunit b
MSNLKTAAAVTMATLVAGLGNLAHAAGESEPGLPQLKVDTWPSQLFWLAVVFGIGYLFMARVVTPRIGSVLEERHTRLDDDLTRAREASAEAAQTRSEYEASLEEARAEAATFARNAAADAQAKADAAEAKAAKRMATKIGKAETKLAADRAEAEGNITAVAAEAAIDTAAQIAGVKATKAQAEKAVKAVANDLARQEAG